MARVIWTKTALDQFECIIKYISTERGVSYAQTVGKRIIERSIQLEEFPKMGAKEPLLAHKKSIYRYLVVWSFKIIYKQTKHVVTISRIFHTAQHPRRMNK